MILCPELWKGDLTPSFPPPPLLFSFFSSAKSAPTPAPSSQGFSPSAENFFYVPSLLHIERTWFLLPLIFILPDPHYDSFSPPDLVKEHGLVLSTSRSDGLIYLLIPPPRFSLRTQGDFSLSVNIPMVSSGCVDSSFSDRVIFRFPHGAFQTRRYPYFDLPPLHFPHL